MYEYNCKHCTLLENYSLNLLNLKGFCILLLKVWIRLKRHVGGEFKWEDDASSLSYQNWRCTGSGNYCKNDVNNVNVETCGFLWADGTWGAENCNNQKPTLCKII